VQSHRQASDSLRSDQVRIYERHHHRTVRRQRQRNWQSRFSICQSIEQNPESQIRVNKPEYCRLLALASFAVRPTIFAVRLTIRVANEDAANNKSLAVIRKMEPRWIDYTLAHDLCVHRLVTITTIVAPAAAVAQ
jgi:hypothetical protein